MSHCPNALLRAAALAALVCAVCAFVSHPVSAQTIQGRILGTVTDSTGAVIPGVTVTILNEATNLTRTALTDDRGGYTVTNLPVGMYSVSVEQPAFKKIRRTGYNLVADGRLTVDFALEPAGTSETVEVVAVSGETVNTVSGEVARVVDTQQVQNLALNARNYMQLATLVPGSVLLDEDQLALTTSLSITAQTINGNRGNTNYLAVDGGSNMDSGSNGSQINNVGIDFIREVNIKSSNFSAEFGRNSGANINVVTRGGEDRFHGGLLEFFRNEKLDASNFFSPLIVKDGTTQKYRGPLRFNDFGWNLGGPVLRGRLFFFAGQEWKRIRKVTDPNRQTMPTRAERAGNFSGRSGTLNFPGTSTPVPGKDISSLMTTDGKAIAEVYNGMEKLAVQYNNTTTANNTIFQMQNPFNWRQDIARVDYKLNDRHSFYYRYLHDMYDLIEPYGTFFGSPLPMTPTNRLRPGYSNQLSYTWLVNPRITNEAKVNVSWNKQRIPMVGDAWKRATYGFQFPTVFGASGWNGSGGVPDISISNFASMNGPRQALMSPTTDIQMLDNFTWIKGPHLMKFGVTVIRNRKDQNGRPQWLGGVGFSTGGNNKTTGNAFADALLGNFRTYTETSADPIGFFRFTSFEGYVSDNWKVNRRLSLEYGLRWQRNLPSYTQANNITNFVPGLYDPSKAVTVLPNGTIVPGSGNRYNGLIRAGDGVPADQTGRVSASDPVGLQAIPTGAPVGLYSPQLLWAPRFSFALQPFRDNRTVLRGGFGVFYDKPEGNLIFPMVNYAPWVKSVNLENGNLANPSGGTAAALTPFASIDAINPALVMPRTMSGSLGIQRELPWGTFFEISYVTNLGRHLIRQPDINRVPFPVLVAIRALPSNQRPSDNSLRPYKGFSSIRQRLSDSNSNYHSMQVYANKRKGRLTLTASYTWSKVLTDASGNGDNDALEDPLSRKYNYGPATFDRSHVLIATYTYQIPYFPGSNSFVQNPVMKGIFAGWQFSGINRWQTGQAYTINANTSTGTRRADYIGGEILIPSEQRGPNSWWNPAAFAAAPDDRAGTAGVGIARGPGLILWDLSIRKNFSLRALHEGTRLQFQADMFNVPNWANFRSPQTNWSNSAFGTVSTAGPSRNVQFALKLNF